MFCDSNDYTKKKHPSSSLLTLFLILLASRSTTFSGMSVTGIGVAVNGKQITDISGKKMFLCRIDQNTLKGVLHDTTS